MPAVLCGFHIIYPKPWLVLIVCEKRDIHDGSRTRNLRIRSPTRSPLRHADDSINNVLPLWRPCKFHSSAGGSQQ